MIMTDICLALAYNMLTSEKNPFVNFPHGKGTTGASGGAHAEEDPRHSPK